MNFIHQTSYVLPLLEESKASLGNENNGNQGQNLNKSIQDDPAKKSKGYNVYKMIFNQIKLVDPNIGCGHFIRAFSSEFMLKKALAKQDFEHQKTLFNQLQYSKLQLPIVGRATVQSDSDATQDFQKIVMQSSMSLYEVKKMEVSLNESNQTGNQETQEQFIIVAIVQHSEEEIKEIFRDSLFYYLKQRDYSNINPNQDILKTQIVTDTMQNLKIEVQNIHEIIQKNQLDNETLSRMARQMYFNSLESTGQWSVCDASMNLLDQSNLELSFKLEITLRLCKVMFLDESYKQNIEEMKFYKIPSMHQCMQKTEGFYQQKFKPSSDEIVIHDLNADRFELCKKSEILISQPFEKPCQSLEIALLKYRNIINDEVKKLHKKQLKFFELTHFDLVHLQSIRENFDEDDFTTEFSQAILARRQKVMGGGQQSNPKPGFGGGFSSASTFRKTGEESAKQSVTSASDKSDESNQTSIISKMSHQSPQSGFKMGTSIDKRMQDLLNILDYIELNYEQAAYFGQKNGIQDKFKAYRQNPQLKEFNRILQSFITSQIQILRQKQNPNGTFYNRSFPIMMTGLKRSALKQKEYDIQIAPNMELQNENEFGPAVTLRNRNPTESSSNKSKMTIKQANDLFSNNYQENAQFDEDQIMRDETDENKSPNTGSLFKKASTGLAHQQSEVLQGKRHEFGFMKRQVSVNLVDKQVLEYELQQDEINQKLIKSKRKAAF
eukprot:403374743